MLSPQQVFTWRRLARKPLEAAPDVEVPMFTPAVLDVPTTPVAKEQDRIRYRRRDDYSGHSRREGTVVIGPSGAVKVMVATRPVDFRKGAEGLRH